MLLSLNKLRINLLFSGAFLEAYTGLYFTLKCREFKFSFISFFLF